MIKRLYTKHKETTHNYTWRALQVLGTHGTSFFIFITCARLLSPYEFGIYNLVFAIIFFLIIFCDLGILAATGKYVAEYHATNKEKLESVLFNAGLTVLLLSTSVTLFVLFFGENVFPEHYAHVLYIIPLLFLHPLYSLYERVYSGLKRFREQAVISLIIGGIMCGLVYLLIRLYGLKGALISQNLLYFLLLATLAIRYGKFQLKIDKTVFKEIGKYSLLIGVMQISSFMNRKVDVFFLGHYNYITEIGYYEIAYKLLKFLMVPFAILTQVIAPDITKNFSLKNYLPVREKLKKGIFISVLMASVLIVSFIFTKDYLLQSFLSKYYTEDMKHLLNLMIPVYFIQMLFGIIPSFAIATGHAKFNMIFFIVFGILNVVLDYLLINFYGFFGVIYSTILIKYTGSFIFFYFYYRLLRKLH